MTGSTSKTTLKAWRCQSLGCTEESAVGVGGERLCYTHALERGNQERAARGFPPVTFDDDGGQHVVQ